MNMEITPSCQVKASFNDDLRRFSVLRDAPFSHLLETVIKTFELAPNAAVVIKYTDNEGEQITMSSDAELREAMQISSAILRVHVSLRPAAPSAPAIPEIEDVTMRGEEGLEGLSLYPKWGPPHGGRGGHHARGGFGPHGGPGFGRGGFAHRGGPYGHHHGPHGGPHGHHHAPPPFFAGEPGSLFQGPADVFAHPPGVPPHHPHDMPPFYGPWGGRHHHAQKDQMRQWKEQRREQKRELKKQWKQQWENMSKEEREDIKAHKKEMKRQWKESHHECQDRSGRLVARHAKDVTIADGTELAAGTTFVKTWRIRNEGEQWPAGCRLLWISRLGDRLNAPESVPVPVEGPVASQQEVEISVDLVAPAEPGRYTCFFRLVTPEGVKFGQRMWVSIVVPGSSSSSSDEDARMTKYGGTAEMIEAMGFSVKKKHIVRMLAKTNGDVDKVVHILAKKEKGCKKDKKERK